jgi:hypothetical protein
VDTPGTDKNTDKEKDKSSSKSSRKLGEKDKDKDKEKGAGKESKDAAPAEPAPETLSKKERKKKEAEAAAAAEVGAALGVISCRAITLVGLQAEAALAAAGGKSSRKAGKPDADAAGDGSSRTATQDSAAGE